MSPAEAVTRLRFSRASREGSVAGELWALVVEEDLILASDCWFKQLIEYPHLVATCRAARVKLLPRRLRFRSCE
jgi:hypothetical protein